jgi:hypothetical protein
MMARKIVQICVRPRAVLTYPNGDLEYYEHDLYALCDDGTVWSMLEGASDAGWHPGEHDIPQDVNKKEDASNG